jgi:hypothetical protein
MVRPDEVRGSVDSMVVMVMVDAPRGGYAEDAMGVEGLSRSGGNWIEELEVVGSV